MSSFAATTRQGSATSDLPSYERKTLIDRSRDAYRNHPVARAALTRCRTNIVGTGLMCRPSVDAAMLGLSEDAADKSRAGDRAKWERSVRAGRSLTFNVTVQGWRQGETGPLWEPNQLVRYVDDWMSVDRDLMIAAVTASQSDEGTTATLRLRPASAFDPLTEPEEEVEGGWL